MRSDMSQEQAEKKKQDLEEIEAKTRKDMKDILSDRCPGCHTAVIDFVYFNMALMPAPFGWIECSNCGTVFCPESLRKQKVTRLKGGSLLLPPSG
jgi:hypothetical protein